MDSKPLRLNLGCGAKLEPGMVNIDLAPVRKPGYEVMQSDLLTIDLPDGCADYVQAIHVLEHLYQWDAPRALAEWRRLMQSGARLVLELPNIAKCAANLLGQGVDSRGGQMDMWGLYGDPRQQNPLMAHRWGYAPATLTDLLRECGFVGIAEYPTRYHRVGRDHRDMRLECRKP